MGTPLTVYNGHAMKLKAIPLLLLLPAFMLLLAACGGGISESDIEATVEARVKAMVEATAEAAPTPTPTPTPPPTAVPTWTPEPTWTPVPPTATPTPRPTPIRRINEDKLMEVMRPAFYTHAYTFSSSTVSQEMWAKLHERTDTLFWFWHPNAFHTYKRAVEKGDYSPVADEYRDFVLKYFEDPSPWTSGESFQEKIAELVGLLEGSNQDHALTRWAMALFGGGDPYSKRHLRDLTSINQGSGYSGAMARAIQNAVAAQLEYYRNIGLTEAEAFIRMNQKRLVD